MTKAKKSEKIVKREIKLIPIVDTIGMPDDIRQDLNDRDCYTHDQDNILLMEWTSDDPWDFPALRTWLIEVYGEEIKSYQHIALSGS